MNDLKVNDPEVLLSDDQVRSLLNSSRYSNDYGTTGINIDNDVFYLHMCIDDETKEVTECEIYVSDIKVNLSSRQDSIVKDHLIALSTDISEDPTPEQVVNWKNELECLTIQAKRDER